MNTPKRFFCSHCLTPLGTREGDTLKCDLFEIDLKRTHKLKCAKCGKCTVFSVSENKRLVAQAFSRKI